MMVMILRVIIEILRKVDVLSDPFTLVFRVLLSTT